MLDNKIKQVCSKSKIYLLAGMSSPTLLSLINPKKMKPFFNRKIGRNNNKIRDNYSNNNNRVAVFLIKRRSSSIISKASSFQMKISPLPIISRQSNPMPISIPPISRISLDHSHRARFPTAGKMITPSLKGLLVLKGTSPPLGSFAKMISIASSPSRI